MADEHDTGTCTLCSHAREHGWWGDGTVTHCRECGATWNMATNTAHCAACHSTFKSPSGFDRHRVDGVCVPPADLTDKHDRPLMAAKVNSHGTEVWAGVMDPAHAQALLERRS